MSHPFLPSTLPLLPLPPPQLLYPFLQVSVALPADHLAVVLNSIAQNAKDQRVEDGGRMLAVVPVLEIERRVGRWACAARVKRIERSKKSEDTFILVLEGLARIRLPRSLPPVLSILPPIPLPISTFSLPLPTLGSPSEIDLLPLAMRLLPRPLHERFQSLPPSLIPDLLVSVLGLDWEARVDLLGSTDTAERSIKVRDLLVELMVARGLSLPSDSPDSIVRQNKPQSALVRRIPPGASTVSAPPPQMPEDLQNLYATFVKRRVELTGAVIQAVDRELARLTKIPPQSAEYGVGRTYIEWLLALPWKRVGEIGEHVDLEVARQKLEDEHEGLEGVKRRVIEYLAVYRLKKQLFLEDVDKKQRAAEVAQRQPDGRPMEISTATDLLELLPPDNQKHMSEKSPVVEAEEGPDDNTYRDKGPILLLVGPPGVGKTSIAKSLATSLGRKFYRISLGGVRDEAEIRGHRRTYVGALPGMLVQALRKVGVSNPLILLDELDKVGSSSFHGDPSAALLETLDPAQNWSFHDHYLGDVTIDLSQVMFIATANTLDTISPPLLDRCEVIECSGYVMDEKLRIAQRFLLPKQIKENGLQAARVEPSDGVLAKVIADYTREAGVRSLEREIGKLCRTKAVEYSKSREPKGPTYRPRIEESDVERILGIAKFEQEVRDLDHRPGVVTGLAYQGSGTGGILLIESTLVPGGRGKLVLTGSLGDVISESAELALTWVKSHALALGIKSGAGEDLVKSVDVHLHLPAGAVKKDGPSAGVGMVLAFVSLFIHRPIPSTTAVTGEITLRGAVTPVGGIKEKVLGAHRAGITRVILPARNRKDVQADLPDSVRGNMDFVYVRTIEEVLEDVWGKEIWVSGVKDGVKVEARL